MPSLYTSLTILSSYIVHVHVLQNSDRVQETTLTIDTHRSPLNQGAEGWSLLSGLYIYMHILIKLLWKGRF